MWGPKTPARLVADEREVRFVRLAEDWINELIVWSVDCVDCLQPFEVTTLRVLRSPRTNLARSVNWRCVDCRKPEDVERGRRNAARRIGRVIAEDLV